MIKLKRWDEGCFGLRAIAKFQFLPHRKHTVVSITKADRVMLTYANYITTLCEQTAEFFSDKAGSI
jgi:hypothetical protein